MSPSILHSNRFKTILVSVFSAIAICSGCIIYKTFYLEPDTKDEITLFLENVMIREGGMFTLVGSKPMTIFKVENEIPSSNQELLAQYEEAITIDTNLQEKLSFEDYKASISYLQKLKHLRYENLWSVWSKSYPGTKNEKYIFATRRASFGEGKIGVFANVPLIIYALTVHKKLFEDSLLISFDPHEIVWELAQENSRFWDRVFGHHFLLGILLGYGEKNAFIYNWEQNNQLKKYSRILMTNQSSNYPKKLLKEHISVSDLLIPQFFSYCIYEPIVEKYQQERNNIIKNFSKKHFCSAVLDLLEYESNNANSR